MESEIINNVLIFVVIVTGLVISLWGYLGNKYQIVNKLFFVFVNLILLNILFSYLSKLPNNLELMNIWVRMIWVTASLLIPAFYFFALYFPSKIKSYLAFDVLFMVIGVVLAYLSMFTNVFINGVTLETWGGQAIEGSGMLIFYLSLVLSILVSFGIIVFKYFRSSQKDKVQIRLPIYGIAIFITANIIFGVLLPTLFNESRYISFGDYSAIIFIGFTAYAILKQRLFDVKYAIIRSVTYVLVLVTLANLYLIIAFFLSSVLNNRSASFWEIVSGIGISLILAFAFQPIKRFFDKITDRLFYKNRYDTDDFYERLNDALTLNTNLRGILVRVSNEIASTIKCEQAFFFIYTNEEHYVTAGTKDHIRLAPEDAAKITEYCNKNYRLIITSILKTGDRIQSLLSNLGIEITLPIVQSGKLIGYLCLGEHLVSGYTTRDIRSLGTAADELSIAVSNALSVQEVMELNATLQYRISEATKELRSANMRLRKLDKAKDEFVSVASHELRTPMTVIRGFIDLLEREQLGKVNDKQREVLSKISLNAKNLIEFVGNMLDLSKLESNKLEINMTDNYMDNMVSSSLEKISLLYENKGIDLKYTGNNVRVVTDSEKFERVLVNLLSNAYKFTPSGGSVTISNSIDQENQSVTMCVSDTGLGIKPEDISRLFKKFSQVDNYLQKTAGGTGLGLSICKQMVEKMGGTIWVESEIGKGSSFYFTVPISQQQ